MIDTYRERLRRLLYRYHPAGVLLSDTEVHAAAETLRSGRASAKETERAHWICDSAMHPVLQQPIPSAFRLSAFAPITTACALGMVSGKSPIGLVFFHCAALPPEHTHTRARARRAHVPSGCCCSHAALTAAPPCGAQGSTRATRLPPATATTPTPRARSTASAC